MNEGKRFAVGDRVVIKRSNAVALDGLDRNLTAKIVRVPKGGLWDYTVEFENITEKMRSVTGFLHGGGMNDGRHDYRYYQDNNLDFADPSEYVPSLGVELRGNRVTAVVERV